MNLLELLGMGGGGAAPNGATPQAGAPQANPVGGFLSRLGLDDPDKRSRLGQSLIALGGSMMKAGGPSHTPNNFLGALGSGMQSFAQTYGASGDDALRRQYLTAQIGNMGANARLHAVQADAAQQQARARAEFNGQPAPAGSGAIIAGAPAPAAPGAPMPPQAPQAPAPAALGGPQAARQAPGAPLDIRPPMAGQPGPQNAPQAPQAPAPNASAPASIPAQGGSEGGTVMARIAELNGLARQARAAGYDALSNTYVEQALALEKHAASRGMYMTRDGSLANVPGYAAGLGASAQAEAAGRAGGALPTELLKMDRESELRREEQALKDAQSDKRFQQEQTIRRQDESAKAQDASKKTSEDRGKELNATWNANEYNKKFLGASNIRAGFERAYADKSGLATANLILDWYKLNDPGSVVSQNEMQTLSTKTQSLSEGLIASVNGALAGNGMSDENKAKLLKNMDGKYQDQRKTYEAQRDNQRKLAGTISGLDPMMVIPDLAELHSPWKSPQELAAEKASQEAAGRTRALGGGGTPAPAPTALGGGAPSIPTFAPNDPKLRSLKKGDQFRGTDGQLYTVN
ncbi:hypothetical protein ACIQW5_11275 [Methylorubrum thiocyanatum]|uniref:hypothetical protein n=1 Tax=Methylorubrum thiocyanatum TaxID=47958 RepID=UPI00383ACC91